jgi:hypothetical protein
LENALRKNKKNKIMAEQLNKQIIITVDAQGAVQSVRNLKGEFVGVKTEGKSLQQVISDLEKKFKGAQITTTTSRASLKEMREELTTLRDNTVIGTQAFNDYQLKLDQVNAKLRMTEKGAVDLKRGVQGVSAATGGATATILEGGRAISDMNFGIRGMANNLTQLATNFVFTMRAAGGFTLALKEMWKAMLGPLGIILAITSLIALWERYSINQQKAQSETAKQTSELEQQLEVLEQITDALDRANVAAEDVFKVAASQFEELKEAFAVIDNLNISISQKEELKTDALQEQLELKTSQVLVERDFASLVEANTELEERLVKITEKRERTIRNAQLQSVGALSTDQTRLKIQEAYSRAAEKSTKAQEEYNKLVDEAVDSVARQLMIQDEITKKIRERQEQYNKEKGILDDLNKFQENSIAFFEQKIAILRKQQKETGNISKELFDGFEDAIKIFQDKIDAIDPPEKKFFAARQKAFREGVFDLSKIVSRFNREEEKAYEVSAEKKLEIEREYAIENVEIQFELYRQRRQARLDAFLKSTDDQKLRTEAQKTFDNEMIEGRKEVTKAVEAIDSAFNAKQLEQGRVLNETFVDFSSDMRLRDIELMRNRNVEFDALYAEAIEKELKFRLKIAELRAGEAEETGDPDQIMKAQDELAAAEDALRAQQLENDRAYYEERQRIAEAYIGYVRGIGGILRDLAGDNKALAAAALVLEKGAAIANIIVSSNANLARVRFNTAAANTAAVKSAYATIPNPIAAQAYATAAIARNEGMALKESVMIKTQRTISIAAILAASIKSLSAKGGGSAGRGSSGGGGGQASRTFDFNLVGSTGQNQLATAVSNQFEGPIRAYVVGDDIRSEEELNREITTSASFGND